MFKIQFANGTVSIPYTFADRQLIVEAVCQCLPTHEHTTEDFFKAINNLLTT